VDAVRHYVYDRQLAQDATHPPRMETQNMIPEGWKCERIIQGLLGGIHIIYRRDDGACIIVDELGNVQIAPAGAAVHTMDLLAILEDEREKTGGDSP
jgi:hypothetical protein